MLLITIASLCAFTSASASATIPTDYGLNAIRRYSSESHIMEAPHYYSSQRDYCVEQHCKKQLKKTEKAELAESSTEKRSRRRTHKNKKREKLTRANKKHENITQENITPKDITIEEQYEARQK
jgi:hypothetical protein